jgi:hypothetical protein
MQRFNGCLKTVSDCKLETNEGDAYKHERNLKNAVFWDVTPCTSCKNRRFGGACL